MTPVERIETLFRDYADKMTKENMSFIIGYCQAFREINEIDAMDFVVYIQRARYLNHKYEGLV